MEFVLLFIVLLLLVLACQLMMVFMHRGVRGGHSEGSTHRGDAGISGEAPRTLDELQRRRDQLDADIERLEHAEPKMPMSA